MTSREKLVAAIADAGTYLCVGFDPPLDVYRSPDALIEAGRTLVRIASDYCAAFKFNSAFFEAHGGAGFDALAELIASVPERRYVIVDAKRADIGSTAEAYAHALFARLGADAVTVNPYMGRDAVEPFVRTPEQLAFVLAVTSNSGADDFQMLDCRGMPLYEHVVRTFDRTEWRDRLGYVVGATRAELLAAVRKIVGSDVPLLVPGVGAQGGDIAAVLHANAGGVMLVNVSRALHERFAGGTAEEFTAVLDRYRRLLATR